MNPQKLKKYPTKPPRSRASRIFIILAVVLAMVVAAATVLYFVADSVFTKNDGLGWFDKSYSDNPLNNERDRFKKILQQAADDASVGWMKEKTVNADGCIISIWNTESCKFDAFLRYRFESDAKKAATQLESRGWQSTPIDTTMNTSIDTVELSDYKKTIGGENVHIIISHDTNDGSYYANVLLDNYL